MTRSLEEISGGLCSGRLTSQRCLQGGAIPRGDLDLKDTARAGQGCRARLAVIDLGVAIIEVNLAVRISRVTGGKLLQLHPANLSQTVS